MSPRTMRLAAVAAVLVLGACNTPAGGGGSSQAAGGGGSQAANGAGNGGGGGSGAGAATLNPCNMLSASDIEAATGWPTVDAGKLQTTDTQADCQWSDPSDDSHGVGVTVADYDDTLWKAGTTSSYAKPVSGLGDAAYAGWPTAGTLNIKIKNYAVTIGIIDFKKSNDQIQSEDTTLANLVLPKL